MRRVHAVQESHLNEPSQKRAAALCGRVPIARVCLDGGQAAKDDVGHIELGQQCEASLYGRSQIGSLERGAEGQYLNAALHTRNTTQHTHEESRTTEREEAVNLKRGGGPPPCGNIAFILITTKIDKRKDASM